MFYKLFGYTIEREGYSRQPQQHLRFFHASKGADNAGHFTLYRGEYNTVLMHVRAHGEILTGLIGKHSTEREITEYDQNVYVTQNRIIRDNDYPHTPFICYPHLSMIACVKTQGR